MKKQETATKPGKKDWVGGKASVFKTLGASNHAGHDRAWADYYATEPKAAEWLLKLEQFDGPILEPSCGEGHISKELIRGGKLSFHGILSTEDMEKWPTFWPSTTQNGTAILLPIHLISMLRSLWRKLYPSYQKAKRFACFSNSLFWKARDEGTCFAHSHRQGYGSAAHVCYAP